MYAMKACGLLILSLVLKYVCCEEYKWQYKDFIGSETKFNFTEEETNLIKALNDNDILQLLECGDDVRTNSSCDLETRKLGWKMVPGTHFCGAGHLDDDDDELGYLEQLDSCCRAHDKCPRNIKSKMTKYGLTNTGKFTMSDCECDDDFYDCLKAIKKGKWYHVKQRLEYGTAWLVGKMFFNLLKIECADFHKPQIIGYTSSGNTDAEAIVKLPRKFRRKRLIMEIIDNMNK